jgi:uncharacterized protein (TIGR03435 family)
MHSLANVVVAVIGSAAVPAACAQASPLPKFEVASIKTADPNREWRITGGPGSANPGQFVCTNVPLQALIGISYKLEPYQLVGPPSITADTYDIVTKVPAGATRDQFLLMIQDLLAERFHLVLHKETRQLPVYELVVAKGGPKLNEAEKAPDGPSATGLPDAKDVARDKDGVPVLPPGVPRLIGFREAGAIRYVARRQRLSGNFLQVLEGLVDRPVVDKTGLAGEYDFNFYFHQDPVGVAVAEAFSGAQPLDSPTRLDTTVPDLFTALGTQLGLKLQSAKGPIAVVVVDAFKKPTEN